ncbi:hypothetical protein KKB44_03535 [Candidatus Micrarchaeota archaeon]|nr:hypothetical protein [Candidatus Micrarchaeota archaeon]
MAGRSIKDILAAQKAKAAQGADPVQRKPGLDKKLEPDQMQEATVARPVPPALLDEAKRSEETEMPGTDAESTALELSLSDSAVSSLSSDAIPIGTGEFEILDDASKGGVVDNVDDLFGGGPTESDQTISDESVGAYGSGPVLDIDAVLAAAKEPGTFIPSDTPIGFSTEAALDVRPSTPQAPAKKEAVTTHWIKTQSHAEETKLRGGYSVVYFGQTGDGAVKLNIVGPGLKDAYRFTLPPTIGETNVVSNLSKDDIHTIEVKYLVGGIQAEVRGGKPHSERLKNAVKAVGQFFVGLKPYVPEMLIGAVTTTAAVLGAAALLATVGVYYAAGVIIGTAMADTALLMSALDKRQQIKAAEKKGE